LSFLRASGASPQYQGLLPPEINLESAAFDLR